MSFNTKPIKHSSSLKFNEKILKYINETESIKEIIPKNGSLPNLFDENDNENIKIINKNNIRNNYNITEKTNNFKNKHNILKSFSENDLFLPYNKKSNINLYKESCKTNKNRPFSSDIIPYKALTLNKEKGFYSPLIINEKNKYKLKKNFSSTYKKKKKKLKLDDVFEGYIKLKSPLDLLVEKKENEFNIKLSHMPIISNQTILNNFIKSNFKNIRIKTSNNNYYYIKSKLNSNTKSTENKKNNQESALKFDNDKYKIFRSISKKIKNNIISNDKKLSIKKLLEKIKKEKNVKNRERISQLKEDIEDNKILYTPKNFIKYKREPFSFYKLNELIQKLNSEFTYRNRFILANKLNIQLDEKIGKNNKNNKNKKKLKNKNTLINN